jgi:hypothetical protein
MREEFSTITLKMNDKGDMDHLTISFGADAGTIAQKIK